MPLRRHQIEALLQVTRELASVRPLDEALQLVTDAALETTGATHSSLRLLDDTGETLLCGARSGAGVEHKPLSWTPRIGVSGWVMEHGRTAVLPDVREDERFLERAGQGFQILSMIVAPLLVGGATIGVLSVAHERAHHFDDDDVLVFELLTNCAVPPLQHARLEHVALTDSHTLAFNRRYLAPRLAEELKLARDREEPIGFLMLDLDHFKQVNDTFGHAAGDEVLQIFADRVRRCIRRQDVFIRRGGEEFVVLLPGSNMQVATIVAERIRETIGGDDMKLSDGRTLRQTVSIGVATYDGAEDADSLELRADRRLYMAKRQGRNRTVAQGDGVVTAGA